MLKIRRSRWNSHTWERRSLYWDGALSPYDVLSFLYITRTSSIQIRHYHIIGINTGTPQTATTRRITPDSHFMGPMWGPPGADRTHVGPMLAPWTLLTGTLYMVTVTVDIPTVLHPFFMSSTLITPLRSPSVSIRLKIWRKTISELLKVGHVGLARSLLQCFCFQYLRQRRWPMKPSCLTMARTAAPAPGPSSMKTFMMTLSPNPVNWHRRGQ